MPCLLLNGRNYTGGGSSRQAIYSGTALPSSSTGANDNIYMRYNENGIITVFGKVNGEWYPFPTGGDGSSFSPVTVTETVSSTSTTTVTDPS